MYLRLLEDGQKKGREKKVSQGDSAWASTGAMRGGSRWMRKTCKISCKGRGRRGINSLFSGMVDYAEWEGEKKGKAIPIRDANPRCGQIMKPQNRGKGRKTGPLVQAREIR